MGIFSSKKKYTVNVTIAPIFEESGIPNSPELGIVKGIMGDTDIVNDMLEEVISSIGVRASTGYYWLKRQSASSYAIGLPSSGILSYTDARGVVIAAISANIGKMITPEYYYMGPLNSMHWGWQHCYSALGYDPQTNELTVLSAQTGFKCYLKDMVATYLRADYDWVVSSNDTGMLAQMGPPPNSGWLPSKPYNTLDGIGGYAKPPAYEVSDVATEDYITISYEFKNAQGQFITRGVTVSMGNIDNTADFHMCRYKSDDGKTGFFTYQNGTGTYPVIDDVMKLKTDKLGAYMPWVYFRRSGAAAPDVETPETMKSMQKWCEYLGVSYDQLFDGVHQDPNVGDVEQAILIFGANPGDKHPACIEYLFKHFSLLHAGSQAQNVLVDGLYQKMQAFTSSPSQLQHIADNRFGMSFQYSGIKKESIPGKIGAVGTYKSEYKLVSQNSQTYMTQTSTGVGFANEVTTQPAWVYQFQRLDGIYDEVVVFGLRVNYEVHRKKGYAAGAESDKLLIPVDFTVLKTMSLTAQEQALCRFLRMQINTVIVTETPWYASGVMQIIMLAVAVVITIMSGGAAWQSLVAAAAIGTTALAIAVITIIVQGLLIQYGVKLFVKLVGPEMGTFVAVMALAVGAAYGVGENPASWAENLLALGTNLVNESNAVITSAVDSAMQELADFQAWATGEFDSLREKEEALFQNPAIVGLEAFDVVKLAPGLVLGENPSAYYDRTVHSGNIGAQSFGMVEYFTQSMLKLPEINDVNGDFYDGGIPAV